jgi:hypothetical protein
MPGPDHREVASINSHDARDAQPLRGRDHGRVRAAELEIGVLPDVDSHPYDALLQEVTKCQSLAGPERVQKRRLGGGSEMLADQITRFRYDERRHDQRSGCGGQPPHAGLVVGVAAIGQGVEDARVQDDHGGLCAAEPVGEEIVDPLGDVRSAAVTDPDERRQRLTLTWEAIPRHRKPQQLVDLLIGQVLNKFQQLVPAGHRRIVLVAESASYVDFLARPSCGNSSRFSV